MTTSQKVTLSYKPWYEHTKDFIQGQATYYFTAWFTWFGAIWMVINVTEHFFTNIRINQTEYLWVTFATCSIPPFFLCLLRYSNTIPEGLENYPKKIQKIVHRQKHYWEYAFLSELLKERLGNRTQRLNAYRKGLIVVRLETVYPQRDYVAWLKLQPTNLMNLAAGLEKLFQFGVTDTISEMNNSGYLSALETVDLIEELLDNLLRHEEEVLSIKPPQGFERLHAIQRMWVDPIHDAMGNILPSLEKVASRSPKDQTPVAINIDFKMPDGIDEFIEELEKIQPA